MKLLCIGLSMLVPQLNFAQLSTTFDYRIRITFPVWLRNRLISAGLEPALSNTEKSCIALYNRQFSTNVKIKIINLIS